eukprot:TRINITY_DN3142_c0_g2_i2.p1 TRINITY_DN3142_c0_g2~~TRINITY_DN3142_c0_g2_i2.p1  ORF type:complete len:361 (+),score=52.57 TRINITY_DN3142_c0_g2_i2:47-1084(+)
MLSQMKSLKDFSAPPEWIKIRTIDTHTGGEPLRVVMEGYPELEGASVLEYRRFVKEKHDSLRKALMFEPRGHADMYGCVMLPPNDETADFGVLFMHNEGYSTMCGHAIIAVSTLAAQTPECKSKLEIDAPCGRIRSYITRDDKGSVGVKFHCVPSFVIGLDRTVEVEGLGTVTYDLAYGGAFYAYVDLAKNNFDFKLVPSSVLKLIESGTKIKNAVAQTSDDIKHPFENDLSFLYGTIFIDKSSTEGVHSRNVCIFADGEVDRSPTGSGVSGRIAIIHKRGLQTSTPILIESITGSTFSVKVHETTKFGPHDAVVPEVAGTAHIISTNTFLIDPNDPLKEGFLLR